MRVMVILIVAVAALFFLGSQGSDSAARTAVGAPKPVLTVNTSNGTAITNARENFDPNAKQRQPLATDTVGAIPAIRNPK